jgi:hypothetical protein
MDLREIEYGGVDWIQVALRRFTCRSFVDQLNKDYSIIKYSNNILDLMYRI